MARLDSRADEHATAYSYPVSHCSRHSNAGADGYADTDSNASSQPSGGSAHGE